MNFLIIDDHLLSRAGLTSLLEAIGHCVVGTCDTGEEALQEIIRIQPDVILLDIRMPGMSGLEALPLIKELAPQTKVVMVTVVEDQNAIVEAIRSGADGFLLKSSCEDEFIHCFKALESGNLALSPCLATQVIHDLMHMPEASAPELSDDSTQELTKRQVEILHLMALGWSNKEIGHRLMVSENTVKYHLKKILQKMNAQNRTEAVAMAVNSGWLELAQPDPVSSVGPV